MEQQSLNYGNIWKSGILHSTFVFTNGQPAKLRRIYRSQRLDKETVTVRSIGWRNFALERLYPVEWEPRKRYRNSSPKPVVKTPSIHRAGLQPPKSLNHDQA